MYLELIRIQNYRKFLDSGPIPFHKITVVVGENDSGKTSILDGLDMFLGGTLRPNEADYQDPESPIIIDCTFKVVSDVVRENLAQYIINDRVNVRLESTLNGDFKYSIEGEKYSDDRLNTYPSLGAEDVKLLAIELGISKATTKAANCDFIKQKLAEDTYPTVVGYQEISLGALKDYFPLLQRYSSNDYGNPESLVKKTLDVLYAGYFEVRNEDGTTNLRPDLSSLKTEIEVGLNEKIQTELFDHIKRYIPESSKVTGDFQIDFSKGLGFNGLKLELNEANGKLLEQYGEGIRKKAFLSILEWDRSVTATGTSRNIIKAYDEPDANLDFAAQRQLYSVIEKNISELEGVSTIICTHSLALIDRAKAKSVNQIITKDNKSTIKFLVDDDDEDIRNFLNQVAGLGGIKNSSIFYERAFLIVEGESEEASLGKLYKIYTGRTFPEDGIILINMKTNGQWSNALKFLHKNKSECIVMLLDADTQNPGSGCEVTKAKLEGIGFDEDFLNTRCFFIGTKEFEDTYTDLKLAEMANRYHPKANGSEWTPGEFAGLRSAPKFSEALKSLLWRESGSGSKQTIASNMADIYAQTDIEANNVLKDTFDKLIEIVES